jgi:hypothetical protein
MSSLEVINLFQMAKQKFRYTRRSDFSGARLYIWYVEYLKNCYNAVDRTFYDAIRIEHKFAAESLSGDLSFRECPGIFFMCFVFFAQGNCFLRQFAYSRCFS